MKKDFEEILLNFVNGNIAWVWEKIGQLRANRRLIAFIHYLYTHLKECGADDICPTYGVIRAKTLLERVFKIYGHY